MRTALRIPITVIEASTGEATESLRQRGSQWRTEHVDVTAAQLAGEDGDTLLDELARAAAAAKDASFGRVVDAIIASRAGTFKAIPSFKAAPAMLVEYLRYEMIDGWVYKRQVDGHLHPYLVAGMDVEVDRNPGRPEQLRMTLRADDPSEGGRERGEEHAFFEPAAVVRKKPADVLLAAGLYKETSSCVPNTTRSLKSSGP